MISAKRISIPILLRFASASWRRKSGSCPELVEGLDGYILRNSGCKPELSKYIIVIPILAFLVWWYQQHPLQSTATIRGQKIVLELAVTPEEKQKGLAYRDNLPADHGMLFLLGEPAYHGFWMSGMRFPLDFIWIDDKTIVDLSENVPYPVVDEPPANVRPRAPADKVLEVNAGTIGRVGISIGDTVSFKN